MTITKELPASTNVPAMLTVFLVSCLKTAFPQVSVVVSFVRQTNAGTIKRTVNSNLASNSKEKTEATTNGDLILILSQKESYYQDRGEGASCSNSFLSRVV